MTSSKDFKQALRSGDLGEAFLLAMSQAPELHITTWIASPEDNPAQPPKTKTLRTNINLIEGKIENQIGEQLLGDSHPQIQKFHHQQVAQGHQTIKHNLESLQKMFRLMAAFQKQQQPGYSQSSWIDVQEADKAELNGQTKVNAIAASETVNETSAHNKLEPQLPSFTNEEDEDDEAVVNDLLSLADLDEEGEEKETETETAPDDEDWGNWLEEDGYPTNTNISTANRLNAPGSYNQHRY